MPAIGDLIGHKFRVVGLLGEGAMGAVYRAENIVTSKQFAIKLMHPNVAERADGAARLLREAQAAARLNHPNVVEVYDIVLTGTLLFLVMELLEGETLRAYLTRNPHPKLSEFIALLLPAMDGVAAAHACGVIHRDLKPENIFLARDRAGRGVVSKVVDFGIAKLAAHGGMTLTDSGVTMGTPLYMSLEQLRGDRTIDGRADVYAFGAMLYEAVCGQPPYCADNLAELAIKIATADPPPVKSIRADVPASLARLIDHAIARDRTQRVPDIHSLSRQLRSFSREANFQRQMTNPQGVLPRLAGNMLGGRVPEAHPEHAVPRRAVPRVQSPGAPADGRTDRDMDTVDTLSARELTVSRRMRHRISFGALAIAIAAIGVGYYELSGAAESTPKVSTPVVQQPNPAPAAPVPMQPSPATEAKAVTTAAPEGDAIADGTNPALSADAPQRLEPDLHESAPSAVAKGEARRADSATTQARRLQVAPRSTQPRASKAARRGSVSETPPAPATAVRSPLPSQSPTTQHDPPHGTAAEELAF